MRIMLIAFILRMLIGLPAYAALPANTTSGPVELTLAGKATREKFFVDIYQVGLYLPSAEEKYPARQKARSFVVDILYDGSLPDNMPEDWKEELVPPLSRIQEKKLRKAYAALKPGDTIRISYFPRSGSHLMINGKLVLHDKGSGLINAFEDIWLGASPVSGDVKQSLLSSLPDAP